MNSKTDARIAMGVLFIIAVAVLAYFAMKATRVQETPDFMAYLVGSADDEHDQGIAKLIDTEVTFGNYCTDGTDLFDGKVGDFVTSGRADSYKCNYESYEMDTCAIVSGSNSTAFVGDENNPNSIFVSNKRAYGGAVDYYMSDPETGLPVGNTGDAMAQMVNFALTVNRAAVADGIASYGCTDLGILFDEASDGMFVEDGKEYGLIVNLDRTIDYAVNGIPAPLPPEPEPSKPCEKDGCAFLVPAVIYQLLLEPQNEKTSEYE